MKRVADSCRNYRDEINSLQIQLSRTQAGAGRVVKEQQDQNSPNHVQAIFSGSVVSSSSSLVDGKVAERKK